MIFTCHLLRHVVVYPLLILGCVMMLGCASKPHQHSADAASDGEDHTTSALEHVNRAVFSFNLTLDRWLLKPVAKGYRWVMPAFAEAGVGNFFSNLGEVTNVVNDVLQWKWGTAAKDTGRFALNSTVGVVGLFDVASKMGLQKNDGEDFAQTLGVWGVPQGPYLVLPFWGPSTLRSLVSTPANWYTNPANYVSSSELYYSQLVLNTVHTRAQLLETEKLASGDFYLFVQDAYLQRREFLLKDGEVEDDFGGEFDEDEEF